MDIACGDSWYVLGNAYVASFFRSSRGIRDLDRALQAYKKAVRRNPFMFDSHVNIKVVDFLCFTRPGGGICSLVPQRTIWSRA